jgi:ASC-1-like (ASCH) protein
METTYADKEDFLKAFNKQRRQSKDRWITWTGEVNEVPVQIKSYNTWVQVLRIPPFQASGPMDCSVKALNEFLTRSLP